VSQAKDILILTGVQQKIAVMDKTLGKAINEKFNLNVVNNNNVMELFRCIRSQLVRSFLMKSFDLF
jgi:hypothetical protein